MTALSRSIALCTILGALVAPSLHAQKLPPDTVVVRKRTTYEDLQMFSQVLNQIRVNHPDSIDSHVLLMAAIQGMVHAADPHSFVIPAVRLSPAREQALKDGKLLPIPVDFEYRSGAPIVVAVAPGTAAARQDILPGDQLVAIDGKPVTAETCAGARRHALGRQGIRPRPCRWSACAPTARSPGSIASSSERRRARRRPCRRCSCSTRQQAPATSASRAS